MKIHVENIPTLSIVYMRRTGAYGEQNFILMQRMKEWIRNHDLWCSGGTIYAVAQDNAATTPPEKCRYDICFVTERTFEDDAIQHGTISSGTYLVSEIPHTSEAIQCFWGSIGEILSGEGKQCDESRPILERYQLDLVEKGYCEVCIPIFGECGFGETE